MESLGTGRKRITTGWQVLPERFSQQAARTPSAGGGSHNLAAGVRNEITTTSGWSLNVSSACSETVAPESWKQTSSGTWCSTEGWRFLCWLEGGRGRIKPAASERCCAAFCLSSAVLSTVTHCKLGLPGTETIQYNIYIPGSCHHSCPTPFLPPINAHVPS